MTKRVNWRTGASRAVLAAVLALAGLTAPVVAEAAAVVQDGVRTFDIPAGPLAQSLSRYAQVTGLQTVYSSDLVANRQSAAVTGEMTPEAALAGILSGTGLRAQRSGQTIVLERVPAGSEPDDGSRGLSTVMVEGSQYANSPPARGTGVAQLGGERGQQEEEADGYRARVASVTSGRPEALEDIPRSISVMTQEQIETQDIRTVSDALAHLPGVTIVPGPAGGDIFVRGIAMTSVQIDGGPARTLEPSRNVNLSLDAYERLELARGPNGGQVGDGSIGGSVNLVRKRPGADEQLTVQADIGSWERRGASVDYSTPTIAGTPIAFRGVASFGEEDAFYARSHTETALLYGIVDIPLGPQTRIEVGAQYSTFEQDGGYQGILRYVDGPLLDVPYDYNYIPDFAYNNVERVEYFGRFYQNITDNWDVTGGVSYEKQKTDSLSIAASLRIRSDGFVLPDSYLNAGSFISNPEQLGVDLKVTGQFETFGLVHNVYAGLAFNHAAGDRLLSGGRALYRPISSVADLDPETWGPLETYPPYNALASRSTFSTVLTDVISWNDRVELTLSASRTSTQNYSAQQNSTFYDGFGWFDQLELGELYTEPNREAEWLPSYALAIKPLAGLTLYGSLSRGTDPQLGYYTEGGGQLGPREYENKEVGVKFARGGWLASLAAYRNEDSNVPVMVDGSQGQCPPSPVSFCYYAEGASVIYEGVDFELTGQIAPGLSLAAGYNYHRNEQTSVDLPANTYSPASAAQVLVDWRPSFLPKFNFNLGVQYRGRTYQSGFQRFLDDTGNPIGPDIPYEFESPSYVLVDLGVGYQVTPTLQMELRAMNLTDQEYYATANQYYAYAGIPRTLSLSLRWSPSLAYRGGADQMFLGDPANWYAGAEVGAHRFGAFSAAAAGPASDGVTPVRWNFETEEQAAILTRLGYRLDDNIRIELEAGRRAADWGSIQGGAVAPTGVCGALLAGQNQPFDCDRVPGGVSLWSVMANALYDFGQADSRVRPFIGAGIGVVRGDARFSGKLQGVGPDAPWSWDTSRVLQEGIVADDTAFALAAQIQAGVTVRLNDRISLDATYRYLRTASLGWESYNYDRPDGFVPALTPALGEFETELSNQTVSVGLRWSFGSGL